MLFKYNALNESGRLLSGTIDGEGEPSVKAQLKNQKLYLVSLKAITRGTEKRKGFFSFGIKHRLPIQLARQLSALLKGGVPSFKPSPSSPTNFKVIRSVRSSGIFVTR